MPTKKKVRKFFTISEHDGKEEGTLESAISAAKDMAETDDCEWYVLELVGTARPSNAATYEPFNG